MWKAQCCRAGRRVRITAQLIDAPKEMHLWAESYERDLRDVLALQSEVAQAIARQVQVKLTPQDLAHFAQPHPVIGKHTKPILEVVITGIGAAEKASEKRFSPSKPQLQEIRAMQQRTQDWPTPSPDLALGVLLLHRKDVAKRKDSHGKHSKSTIACRKRMLHSPLLACTTTIS